MRNDTTIMIRNQAIAALTAEKEDLTSTIADLTQDLTDLAKARSCSKRNRCSDFYVYLVCSLYNDMFDGSDYFKHNKCVVFV